MAYKSSKDPNNPYDALVSFIISHRISCKQKLNDNIIGNIFQNSEL